MQRTALRAAADARRSTSSSLKWRKNMRRCVTCLLVALCMAATTGSLARQQKFSSAAQEVLKVSQARRDASNRRDVEASARYVAEDCLFSTDDGTLITKAQYYEHMTARRTHESS
jgi:Domain of unknown function (DUF4440)